MKTSLLFAGILFSFGLCAAASQAIAAAPTKQQGAKSLGTFGNWKTFSFSQSGQPVCYMTLSAHVPSPPHVKRGQVYLMITHRPGEGSKDVVSFTSGYNFKPTSDVTAVIGKRSFSLFTQSDTAWSRDPATDHALATAISQNASVKFTGSPAAKGAKPITDTLDLKGSSTAYRTISKACGIPVETPKPAATTKKPVKKSGKS
jgi:hypothetical protein